LDCYSKIIFLAFSSKNESSGVGCISPFSKDSSVIEGLLEGIFVFSRKINKLLIYPKIKNKKNCSPRTLFLSFCSLEHSKKNIFSLKKIKIKACI
jgi:hypothetical protein